MRASAISLWAARHAASGSSSSCSRTLPGADNTGLVVCDAELRILAVGRGILELSGYREQDLLGEELAGAFGMRAVNGDDPAALAVEWGVRRLDQPLTISMRSGTERLVTADFFPAYDEDGGLLVALSPREPQPKAGA